MKKITAMILALVLCLGLVIPASAAGDASLEFGGAEGTVGDIIELPVTFRSDVPVMAIGIRDIDYDTNVLELLDSVNWANFSDPPAMKSYVAEKKTISLTWTEAKDFSAGIKVLDLRFKVIGEGSVTVSATPVVKDGRGSGDVSCEAPKANVTASAKPQITGVTFSDRSFVYDGTEKALAVSGNIPGNAVVTYTNEKGTDVGTYNAVASITCDGYADMKLEAKLVITPKKLNVSADSKQMIVGGVLPELTYTADKLCGTDSFRGELEAKADGKTVGSFDITQGTLTAGKNYEINFAKGTLTVTDKTLQTADVSKMPEKTYGDSGFTVEVTNDSVPELGQFVFESSNKNVAEISSDGSVTIKNAGETNIIVKRSGNDVYAPFENSQKLVVKKLPIIVTAAGKEKRIGAADPELTYTLSREPIEPDVFTGALTRAPGEAVGKYDILQGTLAISDNYELIYNKAELEIIDKIDQNISVADFGEKTYGDADFSIAVTPDSASGLESFTYASDNANVARVSKDGAVTICGAGEANISVTEQGDADYKPATVTKKLTVAKKTLNAAAKDVTVTYGDEITVDVSYNGFVTGEDKTVLTKPAVAGGYPAKPKAGVYDIVLSGAEAANYEIGYSGAKLTVGKKDITVLELGVRDKVSDGSTAAVIDTSSLKFDGVIDGDDVTIDFKKAKAEFAQAEEGSNITVTITNIELVGSDAENYNLTSGTILTSASITDKLTARDVAAGISAPQIEKDDENLMLPSVPEGFAIKIKSSDSKNVIKTDGSIAPVEADTTVRLTFEVINETDKTDAAAEITLPVLVPASTKVRVEVVASGNGSADGSGEYLKNSYATVTAAAARDYRFRGWYVDDDIVSASSEYTFKVEDDITIIAKFTKRVSSGSSSSDSKDEPTYKISIPDDLIGGSISCDETRASAGSYVTVIAEPDKGFVLDVITVTDGNGNELELKDRGNGRYRFTMPDRRVTVYASFRAASENPFTDVTVSSYYYEAVLWATQKGITSGTDATHFSPDATCTRAQIVTFLWRAAGSPAPKSVSSFADVPAGGYYAKAVAWAVENGITGGTGNGQFSPDATCTREQAVTFLYRAFGAPTVSGNAAFRDVAANAYYADAVTWAQQNGVVGGIGGGLFGSGSNCTRGQIVTFLYRVYQGK